MFILQGLHAQNLFGNAFKIIGRKNRESTKKKTLEGKLAGLSVQFIGVVDKTENQL